LFKIQIDFDEGAFFYFILPPIIFAAGYTLKRRNFIKNISYILLLGLVGTIFSMIFLTLVILAVNEMVWDEGDGNKLY
jgi:NhaP-type Na+/H+ or K+/H+ antiporter